MKSISAWLIKSGIASILLMENSHHLLRLVPRARPRYYSTFCDVFLLFFCSSASQQSEGDGDVGGLIAMLTTHWVA